MRQHGNRPPFAHHAPANQPHTQAVPLGLLSTEAVFKLKFVGARTEMKRDQSLLVMVCFSLHTIDVRIFFDAIDVQPWKTSPLFRLILFLAMLPNERASTTNRLRACRQTFQVLALLAILLILYGCILFLSSQQCRERIFLPRFSRNTLESASSTDDGQLPRCDAANIQTFRDALRATIRVRHILPYAAHPLRISSMAIQSNMLNSSDDSTKLPGLRDSVLLLDSEKNGEVDFEVILQLLFEMLGMDKSKQEFIVTRLASDTPRKSTHSADSH
jgi:hypothetical protein